MPIRLCTILSASACMFALADPRPAHAQLTLQHEWRFNEPSGNLAFASVGAVTGTLVPGATLGNGVVTFSGLAHPDSAVRFGPGIGQFGFDDFALEFRLKSNQIEFYGSPIEIMGNRDSIGDGNFLSVRGHFGGILAVEISDGSSYNGLFSSSIVFDNAWHDIRIERTGTLLSLQIDGLLDASASTVEPVYLFNSNDLTFGNQYVSQIYPTAPFIGQLDDLRVFSVPGPGAPPLLALGGLLAARRRRSSFSSPRCQISTSAI